MNMVIVATTDGQFLGKEVDVDSNPVNLGQGISVFVESVIPTATGIRLVSSSYIIDAEEAQHG